MRVIIVESTVYKVSEVEFKKIRKMADKSTYARHPESQRLCDELNEYLDEAKESYTNIGEIHFDWRR